MTTTDRQSKVAITADSPRCALARSLEVLGERWTLLVVREAFWGSTKFSEFQSSLGVSTDILTARLATLVEAGVFERRGYRESGSRERFSYHLTEAGRDLRTGLAAFTEWGVVHRPNGQSATSHFRRASDGEEVQVAFVTTDGQIVDAREVETVRGPGSLAPRLGS